MTIMLEQPITFGKYRLVGHLGRGGMAEVFLAELEGDSGFVKNVAIKRLHANLCTNEKFAASFISEARLGGFLNHPNIVQTLELGNVLGFRYITMEYVPGVNVGDVIRHWRQKVQLLPIAICLEIIREVCKALGYAHQATAADGSPLRMIHRDIKPENVLLGKHGTVKLADFGVAKAESNVRRTVTDGVLKGTIGYVSPEQARSEPLDSRSDLFSVGALLFEMLTLKPLYDRELQIFERVMQIQQGEVAERLTLLSGFPEPIRELIVHLLGKIPDDRPSSARAVEKTLAGIMASQPHSPVEVSDLVSEVMEATKTVQHVEDGLISKHSSDVVAETIELSAHEFHGLVHGLDSTVDDDDDELPTVSASAVELKGTPQKSTVVLTAQENASPALGNHRAARGRFDRKIDSMRTVLQRPSREELSISSCDTYTDNESQRPLKPNAFRAYLAQNEITPRSTPSAALNLETPLPTPEDWSVRTAFGAAFFSSEIPDDEFENRDFNHTPPTHPQPQAERLLPADRPPPETRIPLQPSNSDREITKSFQHQVLFFAVFLVVGAALGILIWLFW